MSGSNPFLIEESENFKRSLKKLVKSLGDDFSEIIIEILEGLIDNQYPVNSRQEALPAKIHLPEGWTFHKLEVKYGRGASGQIRLMYLVNTNDCLIYLVWIYNHEQYAKRPADTDIKSVIKEIIEN